MMRRKSRRWGHKPTSASEGNDVKVAGAVVLQAQVVLVAVAWVGQFLPNVGAVGSRAGSSWFVGGVFRSWFGSRFRSWLGSRFGSGLWSWFGSSCCGFGHGSGRLCGRSSGREGGGVVTGAGRSSVLVVANPVHGVEDQVVGLTLVGAWKQRLARLDVHTLEVSVTIAWYGVQLSLLLAPGRIDDPTIGVVPELLGTQDD